MTMTQTGYVVHGAESKRLLHLVLISNLVPGDGEIGTNNTLDVISHHDIYILQLYGGRENRGEEKERDKSKS